MRRWILFFLACILLTGCSEENPELKNEPSEEAIIDGESADEKNEERSSTQEGGNWIEKFSKAPEVQMSPEYLANQLQGPYAEFSFLEEPEMFDAFFEDMEGIPADATEEELNQVFNYLVSQVSVDLTDPQTVIDSWKSSSYGNPELEDSRYHFKENYNIEILIDSSGSMANLANGKSRMEAAKEAINKFLKAAPKDAKVALRVYGHKGTGSDADKELSCKSSEMAYSFDSYDEEKFTRALNSFQPAGWTPLAQSMIHAKEDMQKYNGETYTNMVYVVSDGIETCDGDPVAAAKAFADSNIQPIINIIGFDVDGDGQKQLKEMAEQANGTYTNVYNSDQLSSEFEKAQDALEGWEKWKDNSELQADKESSQRYLDTNKLESEYVLTFKNQVTNMYFLIRELDNLELITSEQRVYLDEKKDLLKQQAEEARRSIIKDLVEVDAKNLEEKREQIQEKYNQNTQYK
ncbi:hypothetical protein AC622_18435 [Bacillus sp. FJAT-27916]|uniref:vWA domain-containing protein n=1 Tax=Bacillus sp. FJAT-27916 TaxID=1679169 RepID=UPI0006717CE1|nr:VWA domain-containing protein [Bacillus sp. FJAT-27916]KMY45933.1 hypothetical protein AC622_18435 [Bacillus sp. FJAT-27916]